MKFKRFFKCYFCRFFSRYKHNKCVISQLGTPEKVGEVGCKYNTLLSLWKWLVRTFWTAGPVYWLCWYFIIGIRLMFDTGRAGFGTIIAWITTVVLVLIILIFLVILFTGINESFKQKGGVYFGKE